MPTNDKGISYQIKLSNSIAIFPIDGETADALVAGADKATFQAKKTRRGYAFVS